MVQINQDRSAETWQVIAGPPEPSEEGLVFEIMTDPAYLAEVRDEQQTWLAEHIVQIIQKARRA